MEPTPTPDAAGARADVTAWLDRCEADATHPEVVAAGLRRLGWHEADVAHLSAAYRARFDEHGLGYLALLLSTGVSTLALGTTLHLSLDGLAQPVDRPALAWALAVLVCSLPFTAWSAAWAWQVEREDPVAAWSAPRRTLAQVLLAACVGVGVLRLLAYVSALTSAVLRTGGPSREAVAVGLLHVVVTVSLALPLGLWSWRLLRRFDAEDPTRRTHRRRPQPLAG